MLKAHLLENIQTRDNVFGSRHFSPLQPSIKPLPTNPPIVGNTWYKPAGYGNRPGPGPIDRLARTPAQLDAWYRQRYGVSYTGETPGVSFIRSQLGGVRDLNKSTATEVSEPNQFNPSKQ